MGHNAERSMFPRVYVALIDENSLDCRTIRAKPSIASSEDAMRPATSLSRVLGIAFLLQAITSFSGVMRMPLVVTGDIGESMIRIANHPGLMRASILGEHIASVLVIFLGAMLFVTLRKQNEAMALVAWGCFLLEVAVPSSSRMASYSLLRISQEYVTSGHPASLLPIAALQLEWTDLGMKLLMLPCCVGVFLFYYLFYKSRLIPRGLSLWGLISIFLAFIGTVLALCGYQPSFYIYVPYVPFEFVIGIWLLIKGTRDSWDDTQLQEKSSAAIPN